MSKCPWPNPNTKCKYGSRQVGLCTKRGAELASQVFHCLIESPQPKENVFLKIDFEKPFNSINRQFMFEKIFEIHTEDCKYSLSAYSQPSFLFHGDSLIKSCEGTQQGDPESPALFSESIQDLIDSLESKIYLWYLDDGNLSDDYRSVLKDHKKNSLSGKNAGTQNWTHEMRNIFPSDHHWKTSIDTFSIFPKTLPRDQNTKEKWTYHSWFTARPEYTRRLIGKENQWFGKYSWNCWKARCVLSFF